MPDNLTLAEDYQKIKNSLPASIELVAVSKTHQVEKILEVYDLQNLEKIYAKESGSILEFKHEGVSASTTSEVQLEKTFQLLFNDFKIFINK